MRQTRSILLACVLAFPLSWNGAAAQDVSSPYEFIETRWGVGPYVGWAAENRGSAGFGPGGGVLFGVRGEVELSGPLGVHLNAFILPTDRNVYRPDAQTGTKEFLENTESMVGGLDARLRLTLTGQRTWHGIAPYVSAGVGVVGDLAPRDAVEQVLVDESRFTMGPSFLPSLSAGTRWLPTERLTVRLEAGFHFWKVGTPENFRALENEPDIPNQQWPAIGTFLLGGAYRF